MTGDNSTGSGGSWDVQNDIIVCADSTNGASQLVADVVSTLQQAGKNVTNGGVGPSRENSSVSGKSNTTIFWIVNGVDRWMCSEFDMECGDDKYWKGPWGNATHCNIVVGFWTGGGGACTMSNINNGNIGVHDGGWATQAIINNAGKDSADVILKRNSPPNGWVAGPDANSLAQAFLTGKGSGGGVGSANITEGYTLANKGETSQFWNAENYEPYTEIHFTNFEIIDENPRVKTASFETTENIDMMNGRVAVLITGDCNEFGGIILKKEYNNTSKLYKYQCQGFMDRIMANPIYLVTNGSKTVHRLIQEILNDCGLPDIYLDKIDEYDRAVNEKLRQQMEKDKELTETTDLMTNANDTKKEITTNSSSSSSTSSSSSSSSTSSSSSSSTDDNTVKTVTKTLSTNKEKTIINTFKRKPVGIYDCETLGDCIRTMIYDYGIDVDFYGDINGIPHFDVIEFEEWLKKGWVLSPERGYEDDYTKSFDITNIITQVGIKNVSAINGVGEIYTSEELLGVNMENFVGRMGVVLDNPSSQTTNSQNQTVDQINEKYQDSTGRTYNKDEGIDTNGQPSCKKCSVKNGGVQPVQKTYAKSWLNECPGCATKGKLKNDTSVTNDYKTVCSKCGLEYCQFCGFERKNGKYQLTELFRTTEDSTLAKKDTSTDED
ncbi:MAG: hypothetical protein J6V44_03650 [Methanobrevibacter sp.]|nr:hypothetical protein [Methanobrevibacter sp.]